MKKGLVVTAVLLLAAGGAAAGWYFYNDQSWNLEFFQSFWEEEAKSVYVTDIATLMGKNSVAADRFAGVVEPQSTVSVQIEPNRRVSEVKVKEGDEVKAGQLLFEYDLSSIEENLQKAELDMERLQNEALSYQAQIETLEKEKRKAKADAQLSYTIEIESNKMNLKKNEYDQKSKQAEIERLQKATGNTSVYSEIDGIVQKIDNSKISTGSDDDSISNTVDESYGYGSDDSSSNAFITLLSTGAYRVKGKVNELNRDKIIPGDPVIIRSRVDENVVWRGTMGYIDTQSDKSEQDSMSYYDSGDSQTTSTTYPFYVDLISSDGLMLGQHVYIETDIGQTETKPGLWLLEDFIVDGDTDEPFVWKAGSGNKLVKQKLELGEYDPYQMEYEILDGVTEDDYIAFPSDQLTEGMNCIIGSIDQTRNSMIFMEEEGEEGEEDYGDEYDDEYDEYDEYDDYGGYDDYDNSEEILEDGDYEVDLDGEYEPGPEEEGDIFTEDESDEVFWDDSEGDSYETEDYNDDADTEPEVIDDIMDGELADETEEDNSDAFPDDLMPVD